MSPEEVPVPVLSWAPFPAWMSFPPARLTASLRAAAARGKAADAPLADAAMALTRANRPDEALTLTGESPERTVLAVAAAHALLALGRAEDALALLDRAAARPDGGEALRLRALTRLRQRLPEALSEIAALADTGTGALSWEMLAALQPTRGWDWVLELVEGSRARFAPGEWREVLTRALWELGRKDEALALLDNRALLAVQTLDSLKDEPFLAALTAEIEALDSFVEDPADSATRGGRQTPYLLAGGGPALPLLLRTLQHAVGHYAASRGGHAGLGTPPSRLSLRAQLVALDPGGHQEAHIHAAGWISGVLYLEAGPDAAALHLPLPPPGSGVAPETRIIIPAPGRLVLFPSHFRHCTGRHEGTSPRLCLAFDAESVP